MHPQQHQPGGKRTRSVQPRTAPNQILQRIQQDYRKCAGMTKDYQRARADSLRMYLAMSKLLLMWQQTSHTDGSINSDLLRIMETNQLMSSEQLDAYRREGDHMMRQVKGVTESLIDEEFFTSSNPMFRDLTPEQQASILSDKTKRDKLYLDRLSQRHLMDNEPSDRYKKIFASEYFGDDGTRSNIHRVWDTDELLGRVGRIKLVADPAGTRGATGCAFAGYVLHPQQWLVGRDIGHNPTFAAHLKGTARPPLMEDALYTDHTSTTSTIPTIALQMSPHRMLQQHPSFRRTAHEPEVTVVSEWYELVDTLFRRVFARMYEPILPGKVAAAYRDYQNNRTVPESWVATTDNYKKVVPLSMGSIAMSGTPRDATYDWVQPNTSWPAPLPTIPELYTRVVGATASRYDALGQLVWAACVEDGRAYPVLPTIHFVSGLHLSLLDTLEVKWWLGKPQLMEHLARIRNELSTPSLEMLQLQRADAAVKLLVKEDSGDSGERSTDDTDDDVVDGGPLDDTTLLTRILAQENGDDSGEYASDYEDNPLVTNANVFWRELLERDARAYYTVDQIGSGVSYQKDILSTSTPVVHLPAVTDTAETAESRLHAYVSTTLYAVYDSTNTTDTSINEITTDFAPITHLYLELGKMRTCPFVDNPRIVHPEDVNTDIFLSVNTQMRIWRAFESRYARHLGATDSTTTHDPAKSAFCNVMGIPLLHPWRRDRDGMGCARDLTRLLYLDKFDDTPSSPTIPHVTVPYLLSVCGILKQAAYPPMRHDSGNGSDNGVMPAPSPSHVHLLRLLLWNLGIWEIAIDGDTSVFLKHIEDHLHRLATNPNHPFQKALAIEDVVHGHPSPLVLAVLFSVCSRFTRYTDPERADPRREKAFMEVYDTAVVQVTHPVFAPLLLKFRSEFLSNPTEPLLYLIWHLIDIAKWSPLTHLYTKLLEYGTAVSIASSPDLYPERHFWREYDQVQATARRVAGLSEEVVKRVRETVWRNHRGRLMG